MNLEGTTRAARDAMLKGRSMRATPDEVQRLRKIGPQDPYKKIYMITIRMAVGKCCNVCTLVTNMQYLWDKLIDNDKLVPFLTKIEQMELIVLDNLMIRTSIYTREGKSILESADSELFFSLEDIILKESFRTEYITRRGFSDDASRILAYLKKHKAGLVSFYRQDLTEDEEETGIFGKKKRDIYTPVKQISKNDFDTKLPKFSKMLIKVLLQTVGYNLSGILLHHDNEGFIIGIIQTRVNNLGEFIGKPTVIPISVNGETYQEFGKLYGIKA